MEKEASVEQVFADYCEEFYRPTFKDVATLLSALGYDFRTGKRRDIKAPAFTEGEEVYFRPVKHRPPITTTVMTVHNLRYSLSGGTSAAEHELEKITSKEERREA